MARNFYKADAGQNVTANRERYRAMIADLFISQLNDIDMPEFRFQQNYATFDQRLYDITWSHTYRLCEVTSLHADKSQTLDHLEIIIRFVIVNIVYLYKDSI